ncbi:MAG TPA: hypothetical protein VK849_10025, partial [Longimicrobiales bacterium]|nr:hypothetical protein [Longimicrobiales bacterium]
DTLSVDSVAARDTPFIPEALAGEHQATLDSAMVITFPLNIASVRSAYDRNPRTQTDEQLFRRPGSRLPLPLEMERRPREGPPARSRLTAPALDQVLEDILATLRARRIRAVGILATDVRDKLFLAEVVHRELPDVLLFTYEGNALFARRDLIGSVRGMVVASSYPLILQNVEWTGGDDWVPFAVEGAAGVFNAALFLLGSPELVQQYRHPDHPYRRPLGEGARVPLWLTTVGTGQLLPLAVVDVGDDPEVPSAPALPAVDTRTTVDPHPDLHGRPGLFETLSVIFAILQPIWLLLVLSSPRSGEAASGRWVWSASRTRGRRADDQWRSLDSLAVMAALLAFFTPRGTLVGIAPAWAGAGEPLFWLAVALNAELALTIAILGVALVRAILTRAGSETRALRRRRKTLERFGSPVGGSVLAVAMDVSAHALALLLAGLAFGYCVQIVDAFASGPTDYGLYRHRALNLASGVSGLLPLLMTAIAVVFLVGWHRDRRRLLHIGRGRYENREVREGGGTPKEERRRAEGSGAERRQSLDLLPEQLAGGSGPDADVPRALLALVEALVRIRGRLEVRVPGRLLAASVPVALLSLVVLRSAFGTPALGTVETVALPGSIIMWILGLGLAVGFLHVGASLFHLVMVWGAFKRFLEGLADTPLAPAFDRLPKRLRTMGRLHVFDPTSDKPGRVLAEAGHEAVWAEASAHFDAFGLEKAGLTEEEAEVHRRELKGTDLDSQRARSLESLIRAVRSSWERGPGHVWRAQADEPKAGSTPAPAEALEPWLRRVEDLLALEGARYVDWVLRNVRRLVLFLFFVMLFTTALLEAMPFPYHAAMTTVFVVLVGVTVLTVIGIMMQLAHDEILSRITGTEPGKLNWHGPSLVNALLFIALPVLGLLGTEVDPVGRTLFGWVQDLLRILSIR